MNDFMFEKVKDGTIIGYSFGACGYSTEIN